MFRSFMFIMCGFLIGQGSMFVVQTYFVTLGMFELIANVGIALGILSLVQWTTDGGGVFFLSKYEKDNILESEIGKFIQARLLIGTLFTIILLFPLLNLDLLNNEIKKTILFSPLVVLIWAFNLTGVADSRNENKILGPISGLSWFFSAIVFLLFHESIEFSYLIGASYCFGLFLTSVIQINVLEIGVKSLVRFGSLFECFLKLKVILGFSSAYIAAQGYARLIPILVGYSIDTATAGIYVYAKNFTNSVSQLIMFSRRVEFTKLLNVARSSFSIKNILISQKISLIIAFLVFGLTALFYYMTSVLLQFSSYEKVALFCFLLTFLQLLWVLSSSLGQVMIAQEKTREFSLVIIITSMISLLFIYLFVGYLNVYSVFIAELIMFSLQFLFYLFLIRSDGCEE